MIKVFILDDDEINNELEIMIMQSVGINNIDVRTSGKEALNYLEECKDAGVFPTLMLVDLNMPGMSGFTFVSHYEKNYRQNSPHTRIVMLSNSILESEKREAMKYESVLDFWNKPLKPYKLLELAEKLKEEEEQLKM